MDDNFFTPANYQQAIGKTFYSSWILIDEQRITDFGRVTDVQSMGSTSLFKAFDFS